MFIYLFSSNGLDSFLIRIPSKILGSMYNSDTVEILALVRLLALQTSLFLTLLVYVLLALTTASAQRMTRSIEEHNYSGKAGFQRCSHGPTLPLHLTASIHSMSILCKERVIFMTSITIYYGKRIMPTYQTPL